MKKFRNAMRVCMEVLAMSVSASVLVASFLAVVRVANVMGVEPGSMPMFFIGITAMFTLCLDLSATVIVCFLWLIDKLELNYFKYGVTPRYVSVVWMLYREFNHKM